MKFKKEIYVVGVLFVFVLGYYFGLNSDNKIELKDELRKEQNFAEQNSASKKENKKLYKV
jgi:hypothetical protein